MEINGSFVVAATAGEVHAGAGLASNKQCQTVAYSSITFTAMEALTAHRQVAEVNTKTGQSG
jgi:hypothetical protein